MRLLIPLVVLLGLSSLAVGGEAPQPTPGGISEPAGVVPGQNLSKFYPGYPDREALIYVAFMIGVDGRAANATVVQGGFHTTRFAAAALKLVSGIRYIPARLDGVPVESWQIMPVRFAVENSRGITPEFRAEMNKVVRLAEAKDYAGAHFHAQWMLAEKVQLSYEYAVLNYTIADTQARLGNAHRALAASRAATARASMSLEQYVPGGPIPARSEGDFILTRGVLVPALRLRFALDVSQGFYLDALGAHADLQGLGAIPAEDPTMPVFEKILRHVQTSPTLMTNVQIDEDGYWDFVPFHRRFVAVGLQGGPGKTQLTCGGNHSEFDLAESVEWSIPDGWQQCRMRFFGAPGMQFRIIELRDGGSSPH